MPGAVPQYQALLALSKKPPNSGNSASSRRVSSDSEHALRRFSRIEFQKLVDSGTVPFEEPHLVLLAPQNRFSLKANSSRPGTTKFNCQRRR
jgi:hypothetical protein